MWKVIKRLTIVCPHISFNISGQYSQTLYISIIGRQVSIEGKFLDKLDCIKFASTELLVVFALTSKCFSYLRCVSLSLKRNDC